MTEETTKLATKLINYWSDDTKVKDAYDIKLIIGYLQNNTVIFDIKGIERDYSFKTIKISKSLFFKTLITNTDKLSRKFMTVSKWGRDYFHMYTVDLLGNKHTSKIAYKDIKILEIS